MIIKRRSTFADYKDYLNFLLRLRVKRQTASVESHLVKSQRTGRHSTPKAHS